MSARESIVEKYFPKGTEGLPAEELAAEDQAETAAPGRVYGFMRSSRERANMVQFRVLRGPWRTFAYAWLQEMIFHPSGQLVLLFAQGQQITLQGRNLARLHDLLSTQRVTWIREQDALESQALEAETTTVISLRISTAEGSPVGPG